MGMTMAARLIEAMTKSEARQHGTERVTDLAHALQCAELAAGVGADLIRPYVPERVTFLVRAHADAKRYLCANEPGSYDTLSRGSKRTLTLQGWVMTADDAARAATQHWWPDVLRLRRWDDEAKVGGKPTRALASREPLLRKYFSAPRAGH